MVEAALLDSLIEMMGSKFDSRRRDRFFNLEEINDSPATAPSTQIPDLFPQYQKPLYGNLAIL